MISFLVISALAVAAVLLIFHKDKSEIDRITREAIARQEYMQSIEKMKKQLIPELMRSEWITSGKRRSRWMSRRLKTGKNGR